MKGGVFVAIGVVGFLALSIIVLGVWLVQKRKKKDAALNIGYMMPSPFASSQNSGTVFWHSTITGIHFASRRMHKCI